MAEITVLQKFDLAVEGEVRSFCEGVHTIEDEVLKAYHWFIQHFIESTQEAPTEAKKPQKAKAAQAVEASPEA